MERYNINFMPMLLEGQTVNLYGSELPPEGKPVKCIAVDAMPEYQKDFGSLTAATWKLDQEDTNLEVATMELVQYRMRVQDDIRVRIKNPASVQKWRSNKTNFWLPQFPTEPSDTMFKNYLWMASEFFVYEDNTPRFDLYSAVAASEARVNFSGWKYKLLTLKGVESGGQFVRGKVDIWINSWPPVTQK